MPPLEAVNQFFFTLGYLTPNDPAEAADFVHIWFPGLSSWIGKAVEQVITTQQCHMHAVTSAKDIK
tara:strand:+ start:427 stop:624 length:198 start_codon:yes stop_codon:yes gene_type:complete